MEENRTSGLMFPKDVADYMVDQGISGRIFNAYDAGGYLIYCLSPNNQFYIDGRTDILYPLDHYYRYIDAERSPNILRAEIKKYDINLAVLKNNQRIYALVRDTEVLELDYVGVKFSLFRRDNPNFPMLGTLLAYPACWNADMSSALEEEQTKAISILPGNSLMLPFIQFVTDYAKTDDRTAFLISLEEESQWFDIKLRFAAYQALFENLDSIAFELFAGIKKKEFGDYLGGALAKARLGKWKAVEQTLDLGTRLSWSEKTFEVEILHGLLEHIRQNFTLEIIDDAYVDRLAEDIGASSDSNSSFVPDVRSFCPDI